MKKMITLITCLLLAGCGEGEVDKVKATSIKNYPAYTYGKVLDNHRVCETADWKEYEEEGIAKVSYTCKLKKGKVSFNFDENTATKIRLSAINQYINKQNQFLPKEVEDSKESVLRQIDIVDNLKAAASVDDFIVAAGSEDKDSILVGALFTGLNNAYSYVPEIRQPISVALSSYSRSFDYTDAHELVEKRKKSDLTAEELEAFSAINKLAKKYISKEIDKFLKMEEDNLNIAKDRSRILQERLNNPDLIKKEAEQVGEDEVIKYSLTHILHGEEVIIWAWNPLDEKYDVERQYFKQYEYGDRYTTASLQIERLIYAASNNITDIDTYMENYRRTALNELRNMIYTGNVK